METVEKIDSDVQSLNSELDRHDGKRSVHCDKRCKYLLGIVGLLLLMFLFGMLTRPAPKMVTVTEVAAVLDTQAPRVVQPELGVRLGVLHATAGQGEALVPTTISTGTFPRILSWTPEAIGKKNGDGSLVSVTGVYELPQGWFGIIRITADGKEVGSVAIDSRALQTGGLGRFTILPTPFIGERSVRITLDAVKGCRLTCALDNQLCLATNVNHCSALSDNQYFLSYTPTTATTEIPPPGSCVSKTFVAGPKYAPQIPEDYVMCAQGKWNVDLESDTRDWLVNVGGLSRADVVGFASMMHMLTRPQAGSTTVNRVPAPRGVHNNVEWNIEYASGDSENSQVCMATVTLKVNCGK